jgi:predicted DNA-binding protein YlxM (UPF0122 family)
MNNTDTIVAELELKSLPTPEEWMAQFKAKRRELMLRLYNNGNGFSMTKIAEIYGVSKQRVQQIIRGEYL